MEGVAETIAYQEKHYDGAGLPVDARKSDDIPLGARILKAAIDLDVLTFTGAGKSEALATMKERKGWYDPKVLEALAMVVVDEGKYIVRDVFLKGLKEGMVLYEDVFLVKPKKKVLAKGYTITSSILEHLKRIDLAVEVGQPIKVIEFLAGK